LSIGQISQVEAVEAASSFGANLLLRFWAESDIIKDNNTGFFDAETA
jgi:hypothetical protein